MFGEVQRDLPLCQSAYGGWGHPHISNFPVLFWKEGDTGGQKGPL